MKDKKSMAMIMIVGIVAILFLFVNTKVFATTGVVTTSDLRLRKEESTSSEIIDLLEEDDKVEIISESGDWYKVKANGKVGYVNKQYIKVKDKDNEPIEDKKQQEEINEKAELESSNEQNEEEIQKNDEQGQEEISVIQENKEPLKNGKLAVDTDIRIMPLISSATISKSQADEEIDVLNAAGLWSYIKSDSKAGWVLTEKILPKDTADNSSNEVKQNEEKEEENKPEEEKKVEPVSNEKNYSSPKTYYVKGTSVNARNAANKSADVVKVLNTNNTVKVTGESDDWYIVNINGDKAYIAKSLLSAEKVEVTSRSSNSLSENNNVEEQKSVEQTAEPSAPVASNPSGNAIVDYAKTFLGYRYVYGTAGPNTFDCSGFVQYVYKHFGYSLSRSSSTQANDGVAVSKSQLQAGDVLIFRDTSNSRIGHVGIYIGGDQFIHASNSKTGVIISSLSSASYQKRYVGARRILK